MSPDQDPDRPVLRIRVALDFARDLAALDAALRLARYLQADLDAVFVEDSDLFQLVGLPFAREICFGSAEPRELKLGRLEREFRNRAEELRRHLEQRAGELQWTFSITRGALPAAALAALPAADLTIFSRRGGALSMPARAHGPTLVWFDGSEAALRTLQTALGLVDGGPLVLLVAPGTTEMAAMSLLETQQVTATLWPVEDSDVRTIAEMVWRSRAAALMVGTGELSEAELHQLLESSEAPVILVR